MLHDRAVRPFAKQRRETDIRLQRLNAKRSREEAMNIDRRHVVLPALAIGLVGVLPAFAGSPDEDAVAKNVEAFRMAQIAADAKAFDALCAPELSYGHSDGRDEEDRKSTRLNS